MTTEILIQIALVGALLTVLGLQSMRGGADVPRFLVLSAGFFLSLAGITAGISYALMGR